MVLRAISSCLATTSRSSDRPPSGGGVSCAPTGKEERYKDKWQGNKGAPRKRADRVAHRVPLRIRGAPRAVPRLSVNCLEATSGPRRCAGAEKEIGGAELGGRWRWKLPQHRDFQQQRRE